MTLITKIKMTPTSNSLLYLIR